MIFRISALATTLLLACSGAALSWTPPTVGQACKGLRGHGPEVVRVAGNYVGGRTQNHGIVDRRSFQNCFADHASCERWMAGLAVRYPLQPGFATCTPVRLR